MRIRLEDIAVVSADDAWAVGEITGKETSAAITARWDGRRWDVVDGPSRFVHLSAVTPDGRGGIWVGADYWSHEDKRVVLHYDGRSWTYEPTPRTCNDPAVFDLASVPGSDQVLAVGGEPSFDEDGVAWVWTRRRESTVLPALLLRPVPIGEYVPVSARGIPRRGG
ncbi:hypothetical protein [Planobispora takensis]|nr:hypothetical protein [Planobispora takensis]